jgi:hypothetical protein
MVGAVGGEAGPLLLLPEHLPEGVDAVAALRLGEVSRGAGVGGSCEARDLEPLVGAEAAAAGAGEAVSPSVEEREGGALRPLRRGALGRGRSGRRGARGELEAERITVGAATLGARRGGGGGGGRRRGGSSGGHRRRRVRVAVHVRWLGFGLELFGEVDWPERLRVRRGWNFGVHRARVFYAYVAHQ